MNKNRKNIRVNIKEVVEIPLKAQSGGGYLWFIEQKPEEINLIDKKIIPPNVIGGEALFVFSFTCETSGIYTVMFIHKRPWEAKPLAQAVFQIEVVA